MVRRRISNDGLPPGSSLGMAASVVALFLLLAPRASLASGESVPLSTVDIPPGTTVTITFDVTVDNPLPQGVTSVQNQGTVSGTNFPNVPTDDPDTGTADDPTVTPIDAADLAISKDDGQASAVPGQMVTYTITVTNSGPFDAVGATVTDTFPAALTGVMWTCSASAGSSCTAGPTAGNLSDVVSVLSGGTLTYMATGTVDPGATGTLDNSASVSAAASTIDPNLTNNTASDSDALTPQGDLAITKDDGQTSAVPGQPVTYTITVTNTGPSDVPSATVADTFPAAITGVMWSCSASAGSSCTAGPVAGNINDPVSVLAGGTLTYMATGTIDPAATGTLANTATVSSGIDPNGANNSATDSDSLTPEPDLSITKDDSADPPPAGQDLIYTITVTNNGPSASSGSTVTDPLPAAVTYVSDDCGGSNVPPWTWNVGPLASGASAACHVTVSINPMPPSSISNTATVVGNETDPNAANDSDTEETTLDAVPPEVLDVDSVPSTGDDNGGLIECETARAAVYSFLVVFSEDVAHASAGDPGSATNPANYRLVAPVLGSDFDTTSCAGGTGADTVIPIDEVDYNQPTTTAEVIVNGSMSLPNQQYRLLVCGGIEDLAGNPLDGGGGAGTDFERNFRIDQFNLFANGHLDCDLGGWASTDPPGVEWSEEDFDASPLTGSAHNSDPLGGFNLSQCSPLTLGSRYDLDASLRIDAAPAALLSFQASCTFYPQGSCAGTPMVTQSFPSAVSATGGGWVQFALELAPPSGAASVRCRFTVATPLGDAYDGYLDELFLGFDLIFFDGFESGDTSMWSATVP